MENSVIVAFDEKSKKLVNIENCYLIDTALLSLDDLLHLEEGDIHLVSKKSQLSPADYLVVKSILKNRLK
jgi:hypothetical protein